MALGTKVAQWFNGVKTSTMDNILERVPAVRGSKVLEEVNCRAFSERNTG